MRRNLLVAVAVLSVFASMTLTVAACKSDGETGCSVHKDYNTDRICDDCGQKLTPASIASQIELGGG